MDMKYYLNPVFLVWGEAGTDNRFVEFRHADMAAPVVFLLEKADLDVFVSHLQRELRRGLTPPVILFNSVAGIARHKKASGFAL
jgi:hypothetical protein